MDKRKAGILLACLLGSVLLLYLGGLLGQLLYNYEEWMRQDGMTGGVLMAELKASPLYCIPYAFTASGLRVRSFFCLALAASCCMSSCTISSAARNTTRGTLPARNPARMARRAGWSRRM